MSKRKVETILKEHIDFEAWQGKFHIEGKVTGIDAAAEAIAKFVDELPVDRVQAMAALVNKSATLKRTYDTPGGDGKMYRVCFAHPRQARGAQVACREAVSGKVCPSGCDHIRAVKMFLARQAKK